MFLIWYSYHVAMLRCNVSDRVSDTCQLVLMHDVDITYVLQRPVYLNTSLPATTTFQQEA